MLTLLLLVILTQDFVHPQELGPREPPQVVYDARSDLSREVNGYPSNSRQVDKQAANSIKDRNAVLLVDDATNEIICRNGVSCYDGDLSEVRRADISFPQDVSFKALRTLLNKNRIVLIDVRNASELANPGQIPGSVNVPLHQIPEAFQLSKQSFKETYNFELPDPTAKNIVLTCRSGRRILVAETRMKPLGYNNLRLYRGSFKDWVKKGGRVIKPNAK